MANALFVDALKGYEYYLSMRGKVNLDQINEYLEHNGRNPIAHRSYMHYQKLLQNGFRSYIPINKFDVFQAIGKIQIAADRRRYSREMVRLPVKFSQDGKKWVDATLIDRSIVGFGVVIKHKYTISTRTSGWIRLDGYSDIPVVITWKKYEDGTTILGVRAMEFIAKFRTQGEELPPRHAKVLRIQHETGNALDWENFYGTFTNINGLIRSAEDLIYSLDISDVEIRLIRSVLQSIRFSSPGETSIKIDFGIADILGLILNKIQSWGLQKRKLRAEIDAQELNNDAIALANSNVKIEIMRNAVRLGKEIRDTQLSDEIVSELKEMIPSVLGAKNLGRDIFAPGSPELAILTERLLPAALDLTAGDDTDYTVRIEDK
ncbi:MAG: PilZ domain-containing protein [Chloroflexi bacterium]|nr:PilZ domain-containing protein [Chloroflexota bacterium]